MVRNPGEDAGRDDGRRREHGLSDLLGIAVEFCSHIARAFMGAGQGLPYDHPSGGKERDERAQAALVDVGPAVSRATCERNFLVSPVV